MIETKKVIETEEQTLDTVHTHTHTDVLLEKLKII